MEVINPKIPQSITSVIEILDNNTLLNEVVFCGSFGLVLRGILDRPVKDLDLVSKEIDFNNRFIHGLTEDREHMQGSRSFKVGDERVSCAKFRCRNLVVDIFFNNKRDPIYDEMQFAGYKILVERPEEALRVKKLYLKSNPRAKGSKKHKKDIAIIEAFFEKIKKVESIDKTQYAQLSEQDKKHYWSHFEIIASSPIAIPIDSEDVAAFKDVQSKGDVEFIVDALSEPDPYLKGFDFAPTQVRVNRAYFVDQLIETDQKLELGQVIDDRWEVISEAVKVADSFRYVLRYFGQIKPGYLINIDKNQ